MCQQWIFGLTITVAISTSVGQPMHDWTRQFGSGYQDDPRALASDGSGGVYIAGYTRGDLGGPNPHNVLNVWLAHYDANGNQAWARQFGTGDPDEGLALSADGAGGVFVAGETMASLGGTHQGEYDAWIARYDSDGNRLWIDQLGSTVRDSAEALSPDGTGGAFVAGYSRGSLVSGGIGAWISRYDANGNRLWLRQFGISSRDEAFALATDGLGGAFVAGRTSVSLGGPHIGDSDVWLARYDANGDQVWIQQHGTTKGENAHALAPDGKGGVFAAGQTGGSWGGPNSGEWDVWFGRYDENGNQLWIRQIGTNVRDSAEALAADGIGGVFISGYTYGSLGGVTEGGIDAWFARYDDNGNRRGLDQFGSAAEDQSAALAPSGNGGAFIAGLTRGDLVLPNIGESDAWLSLYTSDSCYPDCDKSTGPGVLDIFDFLCFQDSFVNAEPYACDCEMSTGPSVCDIFDFLCFQNAYVAGCP